jgi:hypothetical protein
MGRPLGSRSGSAKRSATPARKGLAACGWLPNCPHAEGGARAQNRSGFGGADP